MSCERSGKKLKVCFRFWLSFIYSESWAQVSDKEKEKFQFIYEKEKEIYQQKIATISEDVISSNKATKAQKRVTKSKKSAADELKQLLEETKKPKKPLTAYLLFSMDCRCVYLQARQIIRTSPAI